MRPRQGPAREWDKRETRKAHFILLGVQENVREWTFTLPRQLPFGGLKSWRTLESSGSDCRGQNPLVWRVLYIIQKLLKHKCLKWARITHLNIWKTSYGQKKGRESNWQLHLIWKEVLDNKNCNRILIDKPPLLSTLTC